MTSPHPYVLTVDDPAIKNLLPDGGSPMALFPIPAGDIAGTSNPPIDFQYYVGLQSPPSVTPDGSIGNPFPTLADALAVGNAKGTTATVAYYLTAFDNATESPLFVNATHRNIFVALAGRAQVNLALDGTGADTSGIVQAFEGIVGSITATGDVAGAWTFVYEDAAIAPVNDNNLSFTATFATDFGTGVMSLRGGSFPGVNIITDSVVMRIDDAVINGGTIQTSSPVLASGCQFANVGFSQMSSLTLLSCVRVSACNFIAANPGDNLNADVTSAGAFVLGGNTVLGGGVFLLVDQAFALAYGSNSNVQVEIAAVELELWQFGENSDAGGGPLSLAFNVPSNATIHVFTATDGTHLATVADDVNGPYGAALDTVIDAANGRTVQQFSFVNAAAGQTNVTATPAAGNATSAIAVFVITPATTAVDGHVGQLQNTPGVAPDAVTTGPAAANVGVPVMLVGMCIDTTAPVPPLPGNALRSWVIPEGGGAGPGFTPLGGGFLTTGWGFGGLASTRFVIGTFKTQAARAATFTTGQPVDSFISMMAQYAAAPPP